MVAIIALHSLVSLSISTIFSLNAKKCAKDIASLLSECKVDAMSRTGDIYLLLYKNSDGVIAEYYISDNLVSEETIGKSSLSLSYTDTNGLTQTDITAPIHLNSFLATRRIHGHRRSQTLYGGIGTRRSIRLKLPCQRKIYSIDLVPSTEGLGQRV